MTIDDFLRSLTGAKPPEKLSRALVGLWWDAKGEWIRAHESAQEVEDTNGVVVHAYLHRKEGDRENAAYWYKRAGKPFCEEPFDSEWLSIAKELLRSG